MQVKDEDKKFYAVTPDAGFSPARNKAVVENSIKKYEAMRAKKWKEWEEGVAERSEAVASYLKHVDWGKSTPVERYFDRRTLAYLRGDEIKAKLYSAMQQQSLMNQRMLHGKKKS